MSDERLGRHDRELAVLKQFAFSLADDDTTDLKQAVDEATDRIETLEQRVEALNDVGDMLADVAEEKTSKEEKIGSIVAYAENARDGGQSGVTVLPEPIKGATGVSRRYAYTLIDDMVDEFDWAHDPAEIDRYGSVERDSAQKGVLIDFEGVHGEACPVNKFITRSDGQGVAD